MTNQDWLQRLGMELKVARIRKGYSREQIAELTRLHVATLSAIERGTADSKILTYKRIADAIGIELKELF